MSRTPLSGARGWLALVGLTTALTGVVLVQLPAANAGSAAPATERHSAVVPPVAPVVAVVAAVVAAPAAPAPVAVVEVPVPPAAPAAPVVEPAPVVPPAEPVVRAAVAPAPAAPAVDDLCSGEGWEQRRGAAALRSLRGGAERTGFAVVFKGARSGYLGLTHLPERRIDLYVRSCAEESDELLRHVMAHELGHAWDTTQMTDASRKAYLAARGIPASTPWYGCSGCTDFATPAGDFAEVYAQWARGVSSNRSELAGDASPAQLAALASQFFGT